MKYHYDSDFLNMLKEKVPLKKMLEYYDIELRKKGQYLKSLCPLPGHDTDSEPSFVYFSDKDGAYCFGCGTAVTDSIHLVKQIEDLNFPRAIRFIAKEFDIDLPEQDTKEYKEYKKHYNQVGTFTDYFNKQLKRDEFEYVRDYLYERGINDELIEDFKIGYCHDEFLKKNSESLKKFTKRVIFPVYDSSYHPVGFIGRKLEKNGGDYPKYINTQDSKYFKKKEILFGLKQAKDHIQKMSFAVLVEGNFDVPLFHRYGLKNTIAFMGTTLGTGNGEHLDIIRNYTDNLIIFMDPDEAGRNFVEKYYRIFRNKGFVIRVVDSLFDPAETALKLENELKNWVFDNSMRPEEYLLKDSSKKYERAIAFAREQYLEKVMDVFNQGDLNPGSEVVFEKIARKLDTSPEALYDIISGTKKDMKQTVCNIHEVS